MFGKRIDLFKLFGFEVRIDLSWVILAIRWLTDPLSETIREADSLSAGITSSMTDVDSLTGLLNRAAMERNLDREQAYALRSGRRITIAMIDADHFKKVNDEYGHSFK